MNYNVNNNFDDEESAELELSKQRKERLLQLKSTTIGLQERVNKLLLNTPVASVSASSSSSSSGGGGGSSSASQYSPVTSSAAHRGKVIIEEVIVSSSSKRRTASPTAAAANRPSRSGSSQREFDSVVVKKKSSTSKTSSSSSVSPTKQQQKQQQKVLVIEERIVHSKPMVKDPLEMVAEAVLDKTHQLLKDNDCGPSSQKETKVAAEQAKGQLPDNAKSHNLGSISNYIDQLKEDNMVHDIDDDDDVDTIEVSLSDLSADMIDVTAAQLVASSGDSCTHSANKTENVLYDTSRPLLDQLSENEVVVENDEEPVSSSSSITATTSTEQEDKEVVKEIVHQSASTETSASSSLTTYISSLAETDIINTVDGEQREKEVVKEIAQESVVQSTSTETSTSSLAETDIINTVDGEQGEKEVVKEIAQESVVQSTSTEPSTSSLAETDIINTVDGEQGEKEVVKEIAQESVVQSTSTETSTSSLAETDIINTVDVEQGDKEVKHEVVQESVVSSSTIESESPSLSPPLPAIRYADTQPLEQAAENLESLELSSSATAILPSPSSAAFPPNTLVINHLHSLAQHDARRTLAKRRLMKQFSMIFEKRNQQSFFGTCSSTMSALSPDHRNIQTLNNYLSKRRSWPLLTADAAETLAKRESKIKSVLESTSLSISSPAVHTSTYSIAQQLDKEVDGNVIRMSLDSEIYSSRSAPTQQDVTIEFDFVDNDGIDSHSDDSSFGEFDEDYEKDDDASSISSVCSGGNSTSGGGYHRNSLLLLETVDEEENEDQSLQEASTSDSSPSLSRRTSMIDLSSARRSTSNKDCTMYDHQQQLRMRKTRSFITNMSSVTSTMKHYSFDISDLSPAKTNPHLDSLSSSISCSSSLSKSELLKDSTILESKALADARAVVQVADGEDDQTQIDGEEHCDLKNSLVPTPASTAASNSTPFIRATPSVRTNTLLTSFSSILAILVTVLQQATDWFNNIPENQAIVIRDIFTLLALLQVVRVGGNSFLSLFTTTNTGAMDGIVVEPK